MSDTASPSTRIPSVMEDPASRSIARVYANAFLGATGEKTAELLEEFTSFHDDVLARQPGFARVLLSEHLGEDEASTLLDRTIGPVASPVFLNFLKVLARHGRLILLDRILHEAHLAYEEATGRQRVKVTSAQPLSEAQKTKVYDRLKAVLPFEPIVITKTDPRVLGGLMIQVGDTVYDTSVRARLNQLRARLRQRSSYEIQSGRDRFRHSEGN